MIYDREDGVKIVEFGKGSVLVSCLDVPEKEETAVCFVPTDPRKVGSYCDAEITGMTDEEVGAAITMYFTKLESFDVIFEQLNIAKKALQYKLEGKEVPWKDL